LHTIREQDYVEALVEGPSPEHPRTIIARIAERRERAGQDHLETFPDTPAEVIAWVIARADAPEAVLREDVLDCFRLDHWLQVTLPRRRLALYHLGRQPGVDASWREIAEVQHLGTPQAAQNALARLESAREDGKRSEKELREKRRRELTQETFLEENAAGIRKAAEAFIAAAPDGAPELAEELEDGTIRSIMIWTIDAVSAYSPGLCPAAEVLVAEWMRLPR
jgi:hypothetical protein